MVNGSPVFGAQHFAGEIGLAPISQTQTMDDICSGNALLSQFSSAAELSTKLTAGEPAALNAVRAAGAGFGIAIALTLNIFNPEIIFVGGILLCCSIFS